MCPELNLHIHVSLDPSLSETVRRLTTGQIVKKTSMGNKASQPEPKSTTTTRQDDGVPKFSSNLLVHAVWMNQAINKSSAQEAWRKYINMKDAVKATNQMRREQEEREKEQYYRSQVEYGPY
jgi:hypothetical protein